MKNGISEFDYYLLEDSIKLNVRIEWDSYGEATIEEILLDGECDVTEEILSWGLEKKLVEYAEDHEEDFTSFENGRGDDDRDMEQDR